MEADQMTRGQLEAEFSALARTMYFTGSTVAAFAKGATRGQLAAVCDLIRSENATREENRKADLLIIDEYGYIPIDIEGARLLYQVMSATYETRSMIVTTNIEFGKWGTVLGDAHLATATVDRIMHHGRLVEFGGQSRRFEEALMMGRSEN